MTIEELFRRLSFGEISNLAVAVEGGALKPAQHPRIIQHANEALIRLYSRFILSEKSEVITALEGTVDYPLVATDVIRILAVYNTYGQSFAINSTHVPDGLSTPLPGTLRIPNVSTDAPIIPGTQLDVIYQAKHPVLVLNENLDQEIMLPEVLDEALTAYIAAQMYKNVNTPEAINAAAGHWARYQLVCDEAERYALVNTGSISPNGKFGDRGWV